MAEKRNYTIQSVDRALEVLEAISEVDGDVSISHLSSKLEINKGTVFRLLATFEKRGYVKRAITSGNYRLGLSAYEIGQKFLSRMGLLRKTKPVMESLVREVDETVYLAVPAGQEILLLDMVETTQKVQIIPMVGKRFSLDKISAGRIIRAFGSSSDTAQEFEQIRGEEICIDRDFFGEGITILSVPLFNGRSEVEGCLCFVGPSFRFTEERIRKELLPSLKMAGQTVSSQLGYLDYYLKQ